MKGGKNTELQLSFDDVVVATSGINHIEGFYLNVDMHSVDVDNVAPPTVKLSDAKCHASLLFDFLVDNSLHFGVNKILSKAFR
jgi:hypothetical protein